MPGRKAPGTRSHAKGTKGNRWSKGHSCVSNPTTTKHREQASSGFLHPVSDNPLFTAKNVAIIQNRGDAAMDEDITSEVGSLSLSDISCGTGFNSISTLKSLSSAWTNCSTNAFDRFLRRCRADSIVHKEMLSILAASSDVISGAGGKLNETGFFATFMSLLGSCQPDQYQPIMSLLCIITPRVSPAVLKLKFNDIYPQIGKILNIALEENNELLIRTSIEAFMKLVRVQDRLNLEEDQQLQQLLYSLLKSTLHDRPRVRRKARNGVKRLVSTATYSKGVTKLCLGWILDQLSCFPNCDPKQVSDALGLLLSIWTNVTTISKPGAKKLFEGVLRVMTSGDGSIMKAGFSYFIQVFANFMAVSECDPHDELFSKLIVALWDLQPDTRNTESFILWLRCIMCGLMRLVQGPTEQDLTYLTNCIEASSPLWITSRGNVVADLFQEYFPHLVTENVNQSVLEKAFRVLSRNLLTVPPNVIALQILDSLLNCLSPSQFCTGAQDVFLQLIPLRHAQGVLPTLGKFIRAFGVEKLWTSVDPSTRWLVILPLLQDNLNDSKISFWISEILPASGTKAKVDVVWGALSGFCRNPKDPENFPAQLVGKALADKPQARLQALAALRQFVEWPQCKDVFVKYSKNYLPILFNLYIETKPNSGKLPGHSDAVGVTIQNYLKHCDDDFITTLTESALSKFTTEVDEAASPVFDLLGFLATFVSDTNYQEKILDHTVKKWAKLGDSKRAYRIFTNLSKNKNLNGDVLVKLLETLKGSPVETKSNAAALRLECISVITSLNPVWLIDFLTEIIINLLSVNSKAKKLSSAYVVQFAQHLKDTGKDVDTVMDVLKVGLSSPIPLMISSTLRFAYLLYFNLSPDMPSDELLQLSVTQVLNHADPMVWKYGMEFLSLNLQKYKGALGSVAMELGKVVSDPKYPKKDSTKLLARMIKVFGAVGVQAVIADSEDLKMRTRIKNINKKLRAKSKAKEDKLKGNKDDGDDDDAGHEDSDEEEMDMDMRMNNKTPLIMKEGVVDFLSPSDVAKSFINEKQVKKSEPFKMNKDGKLIINTDESKGRKRSAPDSSDEDDDDDAEEQMSDDDDNLLGSSSVKGKSTRKSNATVRSSGSKFSVKSWGSKKSNMSRMSRKSSTKSASNGPRVKTKGIRRVIPGNNNKKFKSSSSVKSGKSRKSSAASTFRLKL